MAHLALSMMSRAGTAPNHSKARWWQPSQVRTLWSHTNSTYWWREKASVITKAQVRRFAGGGIDELGAGAEVHLRRLAGIEGEAHRGVGRKVPPGDGAGIRRRTLE